MARGPCELGGMCLPIQLSWGGCPLGAGTGALCLALDRGEEQGGGEGTVRFEPTFTQSFGGQACSYPLGF